MLKQKSGLFVTLASFGVDFAPCAIKKRLCSTAIEPLFNDPDLFHPHRHGPVKIAPAILGDLDHFSERIDVPQQ